MVEPMFQANSSGPVFRSDDGGATWVNTQTGKRVRTAKERADALAGVKFVGLGFAWLNIGGAAAVAYVKVAGANPFQFALLWASVVAVGLLPRLPTRSN